MILLYFVMIVRQLESEEKSDVGQDLTKFFINLTGMRVNSGNSTEVSEKSSSGMLVRTASAVAMEKNDRYGTVRLPLVASSSENVNFFFIFL